MNLPFIADKTFESKDYTINYLPKAEYDNCTFINCDFNGSYISMISFLECEFIDCNLSLTKTKETAFKDVIFSDCKLLGVPFNDCNPFLFSVTFNGCILNLSSFFKLKMKSTIFKKCKLSQADFSNTDLTESIFDECDFNQAIFDETILEKVDFTTSKNIMINPEDNRMKHAKFSKENALGLLSHYNISIM